MTYTFRPKGVCSQEMRVEVDDQGVIQKMEVLGGCSGNLQGISRPGGGHARPGGHRPSEGHPLRRQAHLLPGPVRPGPGVRPEKAEEMTEQMRPAAPCRGGASVQSPFRDRSPGKFPGQAGKKHGKTIRSAAGHRRGQTRGKTVHSYEDRFWSLTSLTTPNNGHHHQRPAVRPGAQGPRQRGAGSSPPASRRDYKYAVRQMRFFPVVEHLLTSQGMRLAIPNRHVFEKGGGLGRTLVHFMMPLPPWGSWACGMWRSWASPHTAAFHCQPENITFTLHLGQQPAGERLCVRPLPGTPSSIASPTSTAPSNMIAAQLREHGYTARLHVISNGISPEYTYGKLPKEPWMEGFFQCADGGAATPGRSGRTS